MNEPEGSKGRVGDDAPIERRVETRTPEETIALAARLAPALVTGILLDLRGPLGAGKTHFVRGLAEALDADDSVRSPTFPIVRHVEASLSFEHVDAYRVEDPEELLLHGWDDFFERGFVVVEWGEKIEELLPEDRLLIEIDGSGPSSRKIRMTTGGPSSREVLLAAYPE